MIIVRIWEGLGNQMFQYAYARALKEKGILVRLDMGKIYDGSFEKFRNHSSRINCIQNFRISLPDIDESVKNRYSYLKRDTLYKKIIFWLGTHSLWKFKFYEEDTQGFSKRSENMKGNYYIKGWFQSEKYFKGIRNILLREFTPRKKIKISGDIRAGLEDLESVSIHIRRGDYVKVNNVLNLCYYHKAIQYIKQFYKEPTFLIFSDDINWVKENLIFEGKRIYVNESGRLKDYEELIIMSKCRSNIIANSTFSWWAAWLNTNADKHVIAPNNWFPGQEGIIPDDWIIL